VVFGNWVGNYIGIEITGLPDSGQVYFWRVAAGNARGSSVFSDAWSLTNGPSAIPPIPSLVSPANAANVGGTSITFNWSQVPRASNYYLQVATDAGFTQVVFGNWVGNYIGIEITGLPDSGQVYFWRVASGNARGSSVFSDAWSLTNGPSATPPIPSLVSPANGANVGGTSITFNWSQVPRASNYYLQVATDAGFTQVVFGNWVGNYIGIEITGLPDSGQVYFWRVAAGNARGTSLYSNPWSLTNGPSAAPSA